MHCSRMSIQFVNVSPPSMHYSGKALLLSIFLLLLLIQYLSFLTYSAKYKVCTDMYRNNHIRTFLKQHVKLVITQDVLSFDINLGYKTYLSLSLLSMSSTVHLPYLLQLASKIQAVSVTGMKIHFCKIKFIQDTRVTSR